MLHKRATEDTVRETALRVKPEPGGEQVFLDAPLDQLHAEAIDGEVVEVLGWKEIHAPREVRATGNGHTCLLTSHMLMPAHVCLLPA